MRYKSLNDLPEAAKKANPQLFGVPVTPAPQEHPIAVPVKRIRQSSKPLMNKLEEDFLAQLERRFTECHILRQALRFRLGNGIWYKPDFVTLGNRGMTAFEVKGPHAFRGGFENLKVAASIYTMISWRLVWKKDGQWQEQEVLP